MFCGDATFCFDIQQFWRQHCRRFVVSFWPVAWINFALIKFKTISNYARLNASLCSPAIPLCLCPICIDSFFSYSFSLRLNGGSQKKRQCAAGQTEHKGKLTPFSTDYFLRLHWVVQLNDCLCGLQPYCPGWLPNIPLFWAIGEIVSFRI